MPLEEIAVLYRINARSEPYEEAFAAAGIPYQVRDGAFLRRPGPRAVLQRLKRLRHDDSLVHAVTAITAELGYDPDASPDSDEEVTRQSDLARMRSLAAEFERAHPDGDLAAFLAELTNRFSTEHSGRGVNLLTYHRAKGLEFDAVFLPRLIDGELPFRSGRAKADPQEERRLLYVGITRARRYLFLTWATDGQSRPSPFLAEMGSLRRGRRAVAPRPASVGPVGGGALFDRLKEWRRKRAQADEVPAYVVFHDRTLAEIAERGSHATRPIWPRSPASDRPSSSGTPTRSWRSSAGREASNRRAASTTRSAGLRSERKRQLTASCQSAGRALDQEEANEVLVAERHRPLAVRTASIASSGVEPSSMSARATRSPDRFTPLRQFTATCFPSRTREAIRSPTLWIISASGMNGTSSSGWKL